MLTLSRARAAHYAARALTRPRIAGEHPRLATEETTMPDKFTVKTMWVGANRDINVTNTGDAVANVDRKAVVNALLGEDYHKSSKAKNPPTGADCYLHINGTNTLYALKKADVKSDADKAKKPAKDEEPTPVTITMKVLGTGSVNSGVHKF
jgi:hypothetical protein